jgi:hypothetical protein
MAVSDRRALEAICYHGCLAVEFFYRAAEVPGH